MDPNFILSCAPEVSPSSSRHCHHHTDWLEKQSDQPSFRPSASSKRDLSAAAALSSGTANLRLSPKLRMDFTHVSFLGGTRRNDTDSRSCMPGAETVKNGEKMADSLAGND